MCYGYGIKGIAYREFVESERVSIYQNQPSIYMWKVFGS